MEDERGRDYQREGGGREEGGGGCFMYNRVGGNGRRGLTGQY